jgi:pimeloyl-ACP methyl ester carboxylesterase
MVGGGKGLARFRHLLPRAAAVDDLGRAGRGVGSRSSRRNRSEQESTDFLSALAGREVTDDDLARVLYAAGFVSDPAQARSDPYWEKAWPHRMALSWLSENLMGSDHTLKDLARVECPVLLTKGTETGKVERRVVDLLARHLPDARVVELEGTHAHHIESIDRFLEALDQHLRASPNL